MADASGKSTPRITATHVSIVVAAASLCTAMYQGYLNTRAVGVFSNDVTHRETMRACREAVEFFMESRLRIQRISEAGENAREKSEFVFDARRAVVRFAAVATYLANFDADKLRSRYTEITRELEAMIEATAKGQGAKTANMEPIDSRFVTLNDDCVASVKLAVK